MRNHCRVSAFLNDLKCHSEREIPGPEDEKQEIRTSGFKTEGL